MKTILVVYSDVKKKDVSEYGYMKRYAFNTSSKVKVGEMIKSDAYTTPMVVVKVLDECFTYFNRVTGDLSNSLTNSNLFEIKELKVAKNMGNVVLAKKIKS